MILINSEKQKQKNAASPYFIRVCGGIKNSYLATKYEFLIPNMSF